MSDSLTAAEQRELEQRMMKRQVKDSMSVSTHFVSMALPHPADSPLQAWSTMVDQCFSACVDDFTSKTLSGRETGCISRCVKKQFAVNLRLGERFVENNAQMMNQQQ